MTATLDDAILYAQAGYKVLPLYAINSFTDDDGNEIRECSCKNGASCGRNSGKHPRTAHGAKDATDDEFTIRTTWPERFNIGLAPKSTLVGIDIDDTELANRLMADADFLADYCIAKSGRGVHIYVQCKETPGGIIKRADGAKIGDVKAAGSIMVLPPSDHLLGQYEWVGTSLIAGVPMFDGDAYEYAAHILSGFVEIQDHESLYSGDAPDALPDADWPFELNPVDEPFLSQMAAGTYPIASDGDRSGLLFRAGAEIYRSALKHGLSIDASIIAALIRKLDARLPRPKYANRADAVQRYYETAVKSMQAGQKAANASPGRIIAGGTYAWDPKTGFYDNSRSDSDGNVVPKRLCNFEPLIAEVRHVVTEDDVTSDWMLRCTTIHGVVFETRLKDRDRADLKRSLSGQLPPQFVVEPRCWETLEAGMKHYSNSKGLIETYVYGDTGWLPDRDAFMLPGCGAVTANGIDEQLVYDNDHAPTLLKRYGVGMGEEPLGFDIEYTLETLYKLASPTLLVPMISQAVGAPLASLGASRAAAIVHLFSRTGSYKTSLTRVVLSLYGSFTDEAATLDTWTGTANSIQALMHDYRDLPMAVDDYKAALGRQQVASIVALIQNYADRTARSRLSRDQRHQQRKYPRALVISTGEDVWEGQESVRARSIILDASTGSATIDTLTPVQKLAVDGHLAHLGYLWIQWLCTLGKETITSRLAEYRERWTKTWNERELLQAHSRTRASVSNLCAVDQLWFDFLRESAPVFASGYRSIRALGWNGAAEAATTQAEDARQYSPFESLKTAIQEAFEIGDVKFMPRVTRDGDQPIGTPFGRTIGFYGDGYLYLSEGITFGWYRAHLRTQGLDVGFSWSSFRQEARNHGMIAAPSPERAIVDGKSKLVRMIRVPIDEILVLTKEPEEPVVNTPATIWDDESA